MVHKPLTQVGNIILCVLLKTKLTDASSSKTDLLSYKSYLYLGFLVDLYPDLFAHAVLWILVYWSHKCVKAETRHFTIGPAYSETLVKGNRTKMCVWMHWSPEWTCARSKLDTEKYDLTTKRFHYVLMNFIWDNILLFLSAQFSFHMEKTPLHHLGTEICHRWRLAMHINFYTKKNTCAHVPSHTCVCWGVKMTIFQLQNHFILA